MKISLCLIVKNEEKTLDRCIKSLGDSIDELVIVDTGSDDRTKEIARENNANIYDFKWENDFSSARNFAISKCTGEWIVFLDADEYFSSKSAEVLRSEIEYADKCGKDTLICELININKYNNNLQSTVKHIRVFKNNGLLIYKERIHEYLYNIDGELNVLDCFESIKIYHTGYCDEVYKEKDKANRNIELLQVDLKEDPTSSIKHFYMVESLLVQNKNIEALNHCEKVFKYKNTTDNVYIRTYLHWIRILIEIGQDSDEIGEVYKLAVSFCNDYPDFDGVYASYLASIKEFDRARIYYEMCIQKMNSYKLGYESSMIANAKQIYTALSNIYILLGYDKEAVDILVDIIKNYKDDIKSLSNLLNLLLKYDSCESVIKFMNKIYNVDNEWEKLLLYKGCIETKSISLCKYISTIY